jgi:hypothetical protein
MAGSVRLPLFDLGVGGLTLLALAVLLCLLERSERLLQIRADTVLHRLRGLLIGQQDASFREVGFRSRVESRYERTLTSTLTSALPCRFLR